MNILLFGILFNQLWYALPLIVVVSLVYGATRHELTVPILKRALGFGGWIVGFMLIIFVIIFFTSWKL